MKKKNKSFFELSSSSQYFLRNYLFTDLERKMLHSYLRNGHKEKHFNVLLSLIRRNQSTLTDDLNLLGKVSKKAGPKNRKKSNSFARKRR